MRRLQISKMKILTLLLLFNNVTVLALEEPPSIWQRAAKSAIGIYGAHYILSAAHELAHVLTARWALKAGYPIVLDKKVPDKNPKVPAIHFLIFGLSSTFPKFQDNKINIAINAAGPLCGLLGTYCYLKLLNIVKETEKAQCLKTGIKEGLRKNMINGEQPLAIQSVALLHGTANAISMIPIKTEKFMSDGEKIRKNIAAYLR